MVVVVVVDSWYSSSLSSSSHDLPLYIATDFSKSMVVRPLAGVQLLHNVEVQLGLHAWAMCYIIRERLAMPTLKLCIISRA